MSSAANIQRTFLFLFTTLELYYTDDQSPEAMLLDEFSPITFNTAFSQMSRYLIKPRLGGRGTEEWN